MNKKLWSVISVILVAVLSAGSLFTSVAYAQGGNPGKQPPGQAKKVAGGRQMIVGQVTAITDASFTIKTHDGDMRTFATDDKTNYLDINRQNVDKAQLTANTWVAVAVQPVKTNPSSGGFFGWLRRLFGKGQEEAKPIARNIIILPADLDLNELGGSRGEISAVTAGGFTMKLDDGKTLNVAVLPETRFNGMAKNLAELKPGMMVLVVAQHKPDGSVTAYDVRAGADGYKSERYKGEIASVDVAGSTITISTKDKGGQSLTFKVDSQTTFRSKGDTIKSMADLKAGMATIISARSEAGVLVANIVAAGDKKDLPRLMR